MKKILMILTGIGLLTVPMSCDLDKYPSYAIERSQAFQTIKDAKAFNNGMYASLRGRVYGIYMFSTDVQADLFNASLDYGNRNGPMYRWDFTSDDYTIRDTWAAPYGAIANINSFLDNADKIQTTSNADKDSLANYKGEAHLFRAYYYHQLVMRYAKDYEPTSAATDLGVPLSIHYDVNAKPARATVAQVYDQIQADIAQAKTLMLIPGKAGSDHLTKDVVLALEARVNLCMHKYTEAANVAASVINTNSYPLVKTVDDLTKVWVNDAGNESILQLSAAAPNELPNTNNIYLVYQAASQKYTPDFIPEQWILDLYAASDIRKPVYFKQLPTFIQGFNYTLYLFNKYPGNPALFTAATSNYAHKPKIFRIAEMYLIRAEALAKSGNATDALAALNTLRTSRGLTALSGLSGDALMNEIKDERTREYMGEGFRLDDLKRWGMGVTRKAPQNPAAVLGSPADLTTGLNKPANDNRFVWAIPTNDMTTNSNLVQNPGY